MKKIQKGEYVYVFEDRIHKQKLPKGFSYVLQTTDITEVLSTDGLSLSYSYMVDNPGKPKRELKHTPPDWDRFRHTTVELLSYTKYGKRWGEPGSWLDYDRSLVVYSVPARLRGEFRSKLREDILPCLKALESRKKFYVSVYYRYHQPSNYEPLDRGGIYIEEDRYKDDAVMIYRDKSYNQDEVIKECLS